MVKYSWQRNYSDVSPCIELLALYDDVLKKDHIFTCYAIKVARQIAEEYGLKCKVSWGKWGARLETDKNRKLTEAQLEECAKIIISDPSWKALEESTRIFTYGKETK